MERTKRIFISDIHMGDQASMDGKYCWFTKNINNLAAFLQSVLQSPDVKELVILGDLFDEWVIPAEHSPQSSISGICGNSMNQPVLDGLRALAAHDEIKLSYVPGNHDMALDKDGIDTMKALLDSQIPGIRFLGNPNKPVGSYTVGTIAAEHGDQYCLFNAPDACSANDTFLPVGYFISRMVAHKVATTGKKEDYLNILLKFVPKFMNRPEFVPDLLRAIADDAGLTDAGTFTMDGVPGFPAGTVTLGEIIERFRHLVHNWQSTQGNVSVATAIASDAGGLSFAASEEYFYRMHSNINIVIFGHTHGATLEKRPEREPDPASGETEDDVPCIRIYANTGAWVDGKKCTYVETEEDAAGKRQYVRLKSYPGNAVQQQGFVTI